MRRSGFTMLELVLVIVILGILGTAAMVSLGASRDDAKAVRIKEDVESTKMFLASHAVAEDGVENFDTAIKLDASKWLVSIDGKQAIYNNENDDVWCVDMKIVGDKGEEQNLTVLINENNSNPVCLNLHESLKMDVNQTVPLKGRAIKH